MSGDTIENQYVTLSLDKEVYAVPVSMVREILEYHEPRRIPDGPAFLAGLIEVRGLPVPVIDLRRRLGMSGITVSGESRIMVVDVPLEGRTLALGLLADKVQEVADFTGIEISAAPDVGISWRSAYIRGVVRREDGFVVLLNLPRLLTASELEALCAAGAGDAGEEQQKLSA